MERRTRFRHLQRDRRFLQRCVVVCVLMAIMCCNWSWREAGVPVAHLLPWRRAKAKVAAQIGEEKEEDEQRDSTARAGSEVALVGARLVELQELSGRSHSVRVFVPVSTDIISWWRDTDAADLQLSANVTTSLTGSLQVYATVVAGAGARLNFEGMDFDGFLTVLDLPEGCGPEQCRVGITRVHADIGSFSGTTNALVLICDWKGHRRILSIHDFIVQCALRFLLTLPMVPGMLLLFPTVVGVQAPRSVTLVSLFLVLLSFGCLSLACSVSEAAMAVCACLSTILLVKVQRRLCAVWRRRHRLWRFKLLVRCAAVVEGVVYGGQDTCSICFDEFVDEQRNQQIVLLPCRHSIHSECYMDWLASRRYPSHLLLCPLCRRRATSIGKLPEIPAKEP